MASFLSVLPDESWSLAQQDVENCVQETAIAASQTFVN